MPQRAPRVRTQSRRKLPLLASLALLFLLGTFDAGAAVAGLPDHMVLVPDTLRLVAGVPDTLTIQIVDLLGDRAALITAETLTLWTDRPGSRFSNFAGTTLYQVTVPAGQDSVRVRYTDTQAGGAAGHARVIDADGAGASLGSVEAPVTTVPNVAFGIVSLNATPGSLAANGADSSLVTSGVVHDSYGNPVGAGSRFLATGNLVAPVTDDDSGTPGAQWTTDVAGKLTGWVRVGTSKGAGSIMVVSEAPGNATGATTIVVTADVPAGAIQLTSAPDSLAADSVSTLAVSAAGLTDAHGNAVEDGELYTVATTLGAIASVDQDGGTSGVQVRAAAGGISFTLFGGDSLGLATVTATSVRGSASGSLPIRFVPGGLSAAHSSVVATSPAQVGATGSTVTVTLRDSQDHPLPGVPSDSIQVAVQGVPATVIPLQGSTDGSGTVPFRATATVTGSAVASVVARGVPLDDSPGIVFAPGPLHHYTVTGPAGPLVAGSAQAFQAAARDTFGNAIPSLSGVTLLVTLLSGGATVPDSVTLVNGVASIPFTPLTASPLSIEARDSGSRAATYGPVSVVAGAPYRVRAINPPSVLAAGDSADVRCRLFDTWANAVPGGQVDATILSGVGASVSPASVLTDGAGFAQFSLHAGTTPGSLVLRLLAFGSTAPDSMRADSIFVTVIPAATASLRVLPDSLTWTAGAAVRVRVQPIDAYGNIVTSDTATVTMGGTGAVTWAPLAGRPAAGEFVTFATDTVAQALFIQASRLGGGNGNAGPVTVVPAPPAAIAITSGDGQSAVVAHELSSPLQVAARDRFGNLTPGAGVVFTVVSGGGSLDAIRGGGIDSVAATNASGVASCEVVTLGTAAGASNNAVRARLAAAPSAQALFTASALPDTAFALSLNPAGLSLPASGAGTITATARDRFGNLAAATAVTFYLGFPASGSLESLGPTSGGPGSQSGTTDASGSIAVRYRAPAGAPAADSIFVRGVSIAPVGIRATIAAGTTASLQVIPDSLSWIAGAPVRVRIRAVDAFGNVVLSDTAAVTVTSSGGATWTPVSGPLVSGELVTSGTDTIAETFTIAASRAGGGTGNAGPVLVRPADPAGGIAVAASRDTLTADGRSASDVTLGPVHDAYGNVVPTGSLVTVRAGSASLLAPDASPLPGLDLATASDGRAFVVLIAPATAGLDTLRASSRAGGAAGSLVFRYEPPPSLAYVAGSITPGAVVPGGAVGFQVQVTNTGTGTLQLGTGTTLSFGSGAAAYAASLTAPVALSPSQSGTLRFASVTVSAALNPGTYAPSLRAIGSDGTGEPFDFYPSLAGAQVQVGGIGVVAVSAAPNPVPLGYADLALVFDVMNPTASAATIDAASVAYSAGAFTTNSIAPSLPTALAAGGTTRLTVSVRVPAGGIAPGRVDARLTVTATFAGSSVNGSNTAPLTFQVESAARILAVAGSATPPRYLRARTFAPSVWVSNSGTSTVNLARGATRLVLEHPGGDLLSAGLAAAAVVAGGDQATLAFDSLAVPAAVARGRYSARLLLNGTESGQAFADTIPLDPDSVSVLDPPLLAVLGTLAPDTVSAGQTRPVQVVVTNSGDVTFDFDPSTTLRLGAPVSVSLALAAATSIAPGGTTTLSFAGSPLGSASSPGTAAATLEARGLEDGRSREEALGAGALSAMPPAVPAFVAGSAYPDTVRAGQTYDLSASVRNDGGSPIAIDPAASRLILTDGVEQVVASGSGAGFTLAPGSQVSMAFPAVAFPAALASQPYPVTLILAATEWGLAESATVVSPPSEILVREPADAIQVRGLDAGAPVQVAPGAAGIRAWGLEVTPLVSSGGVTSAHLTSLRLTVLTDGGTSPPPSATIASITLRDAAGTLLAQAVPAGGNPVDLTLSAPVALTAGAESLWIEVAIPSASSSREVALQLASASDLVVLDDLTGAPVAIRGGGGLAFAALTSPPLTLFAKAHGYPNPFHAGREAVRLSYRLGQDAPVHVGIYTLFGDLVRELTIQAGSAGGTRGLNEVAWDGRNGKGDLVSPGVYVARIEGTGTAEQIKVGVLR